MKKKHVYNYLLLFINYKILVNYLDREIKKHPAVGDIVKVLSPSFKDFFRAEIKNVINNDFHVSYIDFGNTEVVQSSNIFELSNELKKEVIIYFV